MKAAKAEPRRWVIDSSFVCSLFLPDEDSSDAENFFAGILSDRLDAPTLLKYEITNVLRGAIRRKRISDDEAREILSLFLKLPIRYDSLENNDRPIAILNLARSLDLSVYDATYLELALIGDSTLLTLDEQLRKAARKKRVKVNWA